MAVAQESAEHRFRTDAADDRRGGDPPGVVCVVGERGDRGIDARMVSRADAEVSEEAQQVGGVRSARVTGQRLGSVPVAEAADEVERAGVAQGRPVRGDDFRIARVATEQPCEGDPSCCGLVAREQPLHRLGGDHRRPMTAVPTRTMVAPSAIAHSRSEDIPIDSSHAFASPGFAPALRADERGVADVAQPRVASADGALVSGVEPHRHEAAHLEPGELRDGRRQTERLGGGDAGLGVLAGDVDLNHHAQALLPASPQSVESRSASASESTVSTQSAQATASRALFRWRGPIRWICDARRPGDRGLRHELLDAVLADEARARGAHGAHRVRVPRLGRDEHPHPRSRRARSPPRPRGPAPSRRRGGRRRSPPRRRTARRRRPTGSSFMPASRWAPSSRP